MVQAVSSRRYCHSACASPNRPRQNGPEHHDGSAPHRLGTRGCRPAPSGAPPAEALAVHRRPTAARSPTRGGTAADRPGRRGPAARWRTGTPGARAGPGAHLPGQAPYPGCGRRRQAGRGSRRRPALARRTMAWACAAAARAGEQLGSWICGIAPGPPGRRRSGLSVPRVRHRQSLRSARPGRAALEPSGPEHGLVDCRSRRHQWIERPAATAAPLPGRWRHRSPRCMTSVS